MRKEDFIAFAGRDWAAVAALKRRTWAESKRAMTPSEALAIGDELRRHAQALHPDWPTEEDRRADLAVHVRVSESLRRVQPKRGR
jgi:hypothetical protein